MILNEQAKAEFKRLFETNTTFATTLLTVLIDRIGSVDFFEWEPEVLSGEIQDIFGAKITAKNADKLQALLLCLTTNQFYSDINAFIHVCNALSGAGVDFQSFDPATVDEMAWAVTEVALLDGTTGSLADKFSDEIKEYVGKEAQREGFKKLPKPLTFGTGLNDKIDVMGDADTYAAAFQESQEHAKTTEDMVFKHLQAMTAQIGQLPLQHGDSESWREFSGRGLRRTA